MSEPETEFKPLPIVPDEILNSDFHSPVVLLHAKDGTVHLMESRRMQVPHTTRVWFSKERQEKRKVFRPSAFAKFNIAGNTVNVLCDGDTAYHGNTYSPTTPTASEYVAAIGTEVRLHFDEKRISTEHLKRVHGLDEVWRYAETVIILPALKDEL